MPITVQWDNHEDSIMRILFEGRWTVDVLTRALHDSKRLMDSVDHTTDIIVEFRNSGWTPSRVSAAFGQAKSFFEHPNTGITFVAGVSPVVMTVAKVFLQMFPHLATRIHFVKTIDEAYSRLAEPRRR